MKKTAILFALVPAAFGFAFVADSACDFDYTEGTVITMTSYSAKGKEQSTSTSTVKKVDKTPDAFSVTMETVVKDDKGKDQGTGTTEMTCKNGSVSIDLRNFVSPQLTQPSGKDMEVKIDGSMLDYPSAITVGQTLPGATMVIHMLSGGSEVSTTTVKISDRKVEAKESRTTAGGTWECYKISYTEDVTMKIGAMNMPGMKPMKVVEWFSYKVGMVRSETYKNDKLEGYTELTGFKKP